MAGAKGVLAVMGMGKGFCGCHLYDFAGPKGETHRLEVTIKAKDPFQSGTLHEHRWEAIGEGHPLVGVFPHQSQRFNQIFGCGMQPFNRS